MRSSMVALPLLLGLLDRPDVFSAGALWCSPQGLNGQRSDCPCGIPCICDGCTPEERAKGWPLPGHPCTHWPIPNNPHFKHQESNTSCKCPDPPAPNDCREPSCNCPMMWFCDAKGEHPPASQGGVPHSCKLTRGAPKQECPGCNEFKTLQACEQACNGTKPPPPPPPPLSKNPCIRFGHTIPVPNRVDVQISQAGPPAITHTWVDFK